MGRDPSNPSLSFVYTSDYMARIITIYWQKRLKCNALSDVSRGKGDVAFPRRCEERSGGCFWTQQLRANVLRGTDTQVKGKAGGDREDLGHVGLSLERTRVGIN